MEMSGALFASRSNCRRSTGVFCNVRWTLSANSIYVTANFVVEWGNDVRRCALVGSLAIPCFRNGTKQSSRPFYTSYIVQLKLHFAFSCQMSSRSIRVPFYPARVTASRPAGSMPCCGSQTFDVKPRKRPRVECKRPTAESEIFLIEVRRRWTEVNMRYGNFQFLLKTTFFSLGQATQLWTTQCWLKQLNLNQFMNE